MLFDIRALSALTMVIMATAQPYGARALSIPVAESLTMSLSSNTAQYGPKQLLRDLRKLQRWAGDSGSLTSAEETEVVAAVLSAAARYYPDVPTQKAARVILADIKAESDFHPKMVSGARLDSGSSWGLMQVSPDDAAQELALFQKHARVKSNTLSWDSVPAFVGVGPLLDIATGKVLDVQSLTRQDLFRPWVNIHIACWVQSNSARTASQDPYNWEAISSAAGAAVGQFAFAQRKQKQKLLSSAKSELQSLLSRSGLPTSLATGFGTWVAGAASNGKGSYSQSGDDVSEKYLEAIMEGVSQLYGRTLGLDWLNGIMVHPGLVDYH